MSFADAQPLYFYVMLLSRLYKTGLHSITNLFSLCLQVAGNTADKSEIIGITKVLLCTIIACSTPNQTSLVTNDDII